MTGTGSTDVADLAELAHVSSGFERADPTGIVAWAWERFADGLVFTSSFEDSVLLDVVVRAAPRTDVVFLDTQYHFAETLWYVEELQKRYRCILRVVRPLDGVAPDNRWQHDVEGCCHVRKVEPLGRALHGKTAWITGVRRADGPSRANAPVVSWDPGRSVVKINPLAAWSDDDMANYAATHELLVHPLIAMGYLSIGCWPCTRPVAAGEDRRSGRWAGLTKTECGLHA